MSHVQILEHFREYKGLLLVCFVTTVFSVDIRDCAEARLGAADAVDSLESRPGPVSIFLVLRGSPSLQPNVSGLAKVSRLAHNEAIRWTYVVPRL